MSLLLTPQQNRALLARTRYAFTHSAGQSVSSSTTFSNCSLGAPHPRRIIVVGFGGASTNTVSSATLGGNPITEIGTNTGTSARLWFGYIHAPSGTTADVALSFSGSMSTGACFLWAIYPRVMVPFHSHFPSGGSNTSRTATVNVPYSGVAMAIAGRGDSGWSGATLDGSHTVSGHAYHGASYTNPAKIPESSHGITSTARVIAAVTFG